MKIHGRVVPKLVVVQTKLYTFEVRDKVAEFDETGARIGDTPETIAEFYGYGGVDGKKLAQDFADMVNSSGKTYEKVKEVHD